MPFFSIIMAVKNGEKYIENTIKSIIGQEFQDFELIIIDSASTDGTLNILKKYNASVDFLVSEPDNGIADAFNKGVMSTLR